MMMVVFFFFTVIVLLNVLIGKLDLLDWSPQREYIIGVG